MRRASACGGTESRTRTHGDPVRPAGIVWECPSPNLKVYGGNENVNLSADGRQLAVSEEDDYDLHINKIDTQWGQPGRCKHAPPKTLAYPNGATPMHNGDLLIVDDLNDRVIVVDRQTQAIIWQYGVTRSKGHAPGYLNDPDGLDLDVFRDWKNALPKP